MILHENHEKHELIREVSRTITCSISESPLDFILWLCNLFSVYTVKKKMKKSGDFDILHEIVSDTTRKSWKAWTNSWSITNYYVQYLGIPARLYFLSNSVFRIRCYEDLGSRTCVILVLILVLIFCAAVDMCTCNCSIKNAGVIYAEVKWGKGCCLW